MTVRGIRAVALVALTACGNQTEDPLPTMVDEDDFGEFLAVETCRDAFDCGCPDLRWDSPTECLEQQRLRGDDTMFVATQNGLTYDAACTADIILRARSLECELQLPAEPTPEQVEAATCPQPCKPYFGDKAQGERCTRLGITVAVDDCGQGLRCGDGRTCVPLCDDQAPLPAGEPCLAGLEELGTCEAGTRCSMSQGVCEALPRLGEPCDGPCASGSWCDRSVPAPVCIDTLAAGEPCVLAESCQSGTCEDDSCTEPAALVCPS